MMRRHQGQQCALPQGQSPYVPARHRWEAGGVWGGRVCLWGLGAGLLRWVLARFSWFGTSDAVPWWLSLWGGAGWGA
jgi:hypothetical protein